MMNNPIIVEVVTIINPTVGNATKSGSIEVLLSMNLLVKFRNVDLNITLSFL